jgi:hypothetical protein
MDSADLIVFIVAFAVACGIAFGLRYFLHGRRFKLHESGTYYVLKRNNVEEGAFDQDASFSSEQIEEIVKSKLVECADLLETHFDFRTSAGGMLEIVFGERMYQDVDQIPDERLRKAIAEAVSEFNRE